MSTPTRTSRKPPGVPNSVFALAQPDGAAPKVAQAAKAPSKTGNAAPLPLIDLAKLKVETGAPVEPRTLAARGDSKWAPLFALLTKPGTSVVVPVSYKGALYAYAKKGKKSGGLPGSYVVRRCAKDPTHCRVSRTA